MDEESQLRRVHALMADGHWRTLRQIAFSVQSSEAAVSARLRDLRKPQYGGHGVSKVRIDNGVFVYRLESKSTKE